VCWRHFHGRSVEVLDTVIVDQSPLFVDRLITPSLPAIARSAFHCFSAFALRYILRLSSCRLTEGFIIPSLPHLAVERIKLSMAPLLQRHYSPSSLLRATPPSCLPFGPFPVSTVIGPTSLREFLPGAYRTSPVSIVSLLPCRRHYPADVNYPSSQTEIIHAVFATY